MPYVLVAFHQAVIIGRSISGYNNLHIHSAVIRTRLCRNVYSNNYNRAIQWVGGKLLPSDWWMEYYCIAECIVQQNGMPIKAERGADYSRVEMSMITAGTALANFNFNRRKYIQTAKSINTTATF